MIILAKSTQSKHVNFVHKKNPSFKILTIKLQNASKKAAQIQHTSMEANENYLFERKNENLQALNNKVFKICKILEVTKCI